MKKQLMFTCLLSLGFVTMIKAQDSTKATYTAPALHRMEFGIRFMPTFSAFDMHTSTGGTVKGEVTLGYGIGGMLAFNLSNHVGIQTELIYNSLSQKYVDQNITHEVKIRYVNIPVLLSLNTGKSKPVNLNVVFGPQLGINVGSSVSTSGGPSSDTLQAVMVTKKNDFGFAYGAGLEFMLNSTRTIRLDLGFRGVYGFVNISNTDQPATTNSYYILDRATVRTYSGYAGISFLF